MYKLAVSFIRLSACSAYTKVINEFSNIAQRSILRFVYSKQNLVTSLIKPIAVSPVSRYLPFFFPGKNSTQFLLISGFFGLVAEKKEDEKESELITTIKRAVLMIQRDEFSAAEQMLHIALKLAQEQRNEDGITYIYDLLANVAFSQGHYKKAEKLFVNVMQRLLSNGIPEEDIKINHMSLKLAKIYEESKEYLKAEEGYKFCLKNLQKKVDSDDRDEDALSLWAMSLDWYARFLLERERMDEALDNFKKAYDMSLRVNGEIHEQTVVLLNDLGTISFLKGDCDAAIQYLSQAVEIGKHLPNMEDFSSVHVNLGNIYLQKKLYTEAEKYCTEGFKNAKRHKNNEGLQEATLCLNELKKATA